MDRLFSSSDVFKVLCHKFVIIIGDSIHRSIYKDLVLLLQKDEYLTQDELKRKGEHSFMDDELIEGGKKDGLSNGISYKEVRQFKTEKHHIRFYFVTRCYNTYVKSILLDMQGEPCPDIVVMNSCVWDVSRYGEQSMMDYRANIVSLFCGLQHVLSEDCLMIWNTTLPVSRHAQGGFLPPELEFQVPKLAADIDTANKYTTCAARFFKIHILDLHSYLWNHGELQVADGIHWDMMAHRFITNLIMEIVCDYFGAHAPRRRPAQPCARRTPPLHPFNFNGPLLPRPTHHGDMSATPIIRRRGFTRTQRSNRHFDQSPNCSHGSADIHSPFSDTSRDEEFHTDYHSPVTYRQSPNYVDFEIPNFVHSPIQFQTQDYFYSPSNHFESSGSQAQSPSFYQSPVNFHRPGSFRSPNLCESLDRLEDQAFNPQNWNDKSRYTQSCVPPLAARVNNFLNLGQYNQQAPPSGAIRHNARRRYRPYRGDDR